MTSLAGADTGALAGSVNCAANGQNSLTSALVNVLLFLTVLIDRPYGLNPFSFQNSLLSNCSFVCQLVRVSTFGAS